MDYKLYFLDSTGRITGRVDLEFVDDAAALDAFALAENPNKLALEMWRGAERIGRSEAG